MRMEVQLNRYFDAGTITRGMAYARQGRVRQITAAKGGGGDRHVLQGQVRGSGRQPYVCVVSVQSRPGRPASVSGTCSCPVGEDCKHVVAVLVAAADQGAQPPSWERALGALVDRPEDRRSAYQPIGLLIRFVDAVPASLSIRPVTIGARGTWVQQGLSWNDLGMYGYLRHTFDPAAIQALREVKLLAERSAPSYQSHYYSSAPPGWSCKTRPAARCGRRSASPPARGSSCCATTRHAPACGSTASVPS